MKTTTIGIDLAKTVFQIHGVDERGKVAVRKQLKRAEQQAILSVHRARQGFVKARTAQGNQIRGLLAEFGIVIPQGIGTIAKRIPEILEDAENGLPGAMRNLLARLADNLKEMDRQAKELEAQIQVWHRDNAASRKLAEIPGLGPITASAIVATVGDAREFKNGRQLAAWMGLVPNRAPAAASRLCWASANAATPTCAP